MMQITDVLSGFNSLVGRYPVAYWQQRRHAASHDEIFDGALFDIRSHFASAQMTLGRPTEALQDELNTVLNGLERNRSMLYGVQHLERVALKMQVCLDEQIIRDALGDHPLLEELSDRTHACLVQITDPHAVKAFYQDVLEMIRPAVLDVIGQNIQICCHMVDQAWGLPAGSEGQILQELVCVLAQHRKMHTANTLQVLHGTVQERLEAFLDPMDQRCRDALLGFISKVPADVQECIVQLDEPDFRSLQALQRAMASHLDAEDELSLRDQMQPFLIWYKMLEDVKLLEHLDTWEPAFLGCPMFYQRIRMMVSEVHDNEERAFASRWPTGKGWPAPDDATWSEKLWYGWMALRPFWVLCAGAVSLALLWSGAPQMALVCQGLVLWGDAFRTYHKMRSHARELTKHRYRQRWQAHRADWSHDEAPPHPIDVPQTQVLADPEDLKIEDDPDDLKEALEVKARGSAYQVALGLCPEEPWVTRCLLYSSQGNQALGLLEVWVRWGLQMLWDWGWLLRDLGLSAGLATVGQVLSLLGVALYLAHALQIFRRNVQRTQEADWSEPARRNMRMLHALVLACSLGGIALMVWRVVSHVQVVGLLLAVAIQVFGLCRERVKVVLKTYKSHWMDAQPLTRWEVLRHTVGWHDVPELANVDTAGM